MKDEGLLKKRLTEFRLKYPEAIIPDIVYDLLDETRADIEGKVKTEERIWYDYEKEVFPRVPNPLVSQHVPKAVRERAGCKWIRLSDVLKWLGSSEAKE